jgi:Mg2+ and Co2+ transporter CorA
MSDHQKKSRKFGLPHIFGVAIVIAIIAYAYFYYP